MERREPERVREQLEAAQRLAGIGSWYADRRTAVTELWEAKRAAESSEERLERVLAATQDGWWESDLVAGVTYHSPRWWEIHGLEPGDLPVSPDLWRTLTHPDDVAAVERLLERAIATRTPRHTLTSRIRHADGHLVPVSVRMLIQFDEDGRPIRISGTATDITELRRTQQMQDEFVSTVSHELRTPLTAIGGALELLTRTLPEDLDERSRELLEMAERNTERLRRLIDDLLDAEQLARPQDFAFDRVRLVDVITEVLTDHAAYAATHGVGVTFTRQVPDATVVVDRGRLEQVLANYLSNAVKFAPQGSDVEVALSRRSGRIRTEVIDRGPGVPASFAGRAFTRFAQADPSDPRSRGGTGLGLAITRELVEAFGGAVGYDSVPGRTSFWFDLPESTG